MYGQRVRLSLAQLYCWWAHLNGCIAQSDLAGSNSAQLDLEVVLNFIVEPVRDYDYLLKKIVRVLVLLGLSLSSRYG